MSGISVLDLQNHDLYFKRIPRVDKKKKPIWSRKELAGRLCELSSIYGTAQLTAAFQLVLDAQFEGEPTAWITTTLDTFFAPDAAEGGVDLDALVVIHVPNTAAATRAADRILQSGGFGLVVMDLHSDSRIPIPMQMRLVQQVREHNTAFLCLTIKSKDMPSLGPMVSLRGQTSCRRLTVGRFQYEIEVLKDRSYGPGWHYAEICRGPDGLH
tara:strand:- start:174391 stop:175026 length:636 start_codon:yes stop_codon:yes gene_type:complete